MDIQALMLPMAWVRGALAGDPSVLEPGKLTREAEREAGVIIVLACRILVARRFAMSTDRRIEPFAWQVLQDPMLAEVFTPHEIDAVIRAALGDTARPAMVREDRAVAAHLLVARALLGETPYAPGQVDAVLESAQAQARTLLAAQDAAPAVEGRGRRRVPSVVARTALAVAAVALVCGYLVAGFVAPGFLTVPAAYQGRNGPPDEERFVTRMAQVLEDRDRAAFEAMLCSTAEDVDLYIYRLGDVDSVTISRVVGDASDADFYYFTFHITRPGEPAEPWNGILHKEDASWCLSQFSRE